MAEKSSKKKYTLFKAGDPSSGPKACAFFASADGCRNGAKCLFLHEENGRIIPTQAKIPVKETPARSVSASASAPAPPVIPSPKPKAEVVVAVPKVASPALPTSATKKRKSDEALLYSTQESIKVAKTPISRPPVAASNDDSDQDDDHSLVFGAVDVAINQLTPVTAAMKSKSRKITPEESASKSTHARPVSQGTLEFRGPQETARALSTSGTAHATQGPRQGGGTAAITKQTPPSKAQPSFSVAKNVASSNPVAFIATPPKPAAASKTSTAAPSPGGDLLQEALKLISAGGKTTIAKARETPEVRDLIDPRARDWLHLVEKTRAHQKFAKDYTFQTDAGWIKASPNAKRYFKL
jgi:hypothetical protein